MLRVRHAEMGTRLFEAADHFLRNWTNRLQSAQFSQSCLFAVVWNCRDCSERKVEWFFALSYCAWPTPDGAAWLENLVRFLPRFRRLLLPPSVLRCQACQRTGSQPQDFGTWLPRFPVARDLLQIDLVDDLLLDASALLYLTRTALSSSSWCPPTLWSSLSRTSVCSPAPHNNFDLSLIF